VHHLPVLDGDRLLAIVSERQLAVQWIIEPLAQRRRAIRELARHRPPQVAPDDDLRHVADCMRVSDTDAVAVTGRDGSLQGAGRRQGAHSASTQCEQRPRHRAPSPRMQP